VAFGYTAAIMCPGCVRSSRTARPLDECAFLMGDDSASSNTELMVALRPSLATTGGPMLLTS
jgi:hypothetical protein